MNPAAAAYLIRKLGIRLRPLMFVFLFATAVTLIGLFIVVIQSNIGKAKIGRQSFPLFSAVIFCASAPLGWFIRAMAIAGSWQNFEKIEHEHREGRSRRAWDLLMKRYRIHAAVIQSERFRRFLREQCDYITYSEQLTPDQSRMVQRMEVAINDADVRLAGTGAKGSTAELGRWILAVGTAIVLVRALAELAQVVSRMQVGR